jgi:bacterioferritin-associated ferredoxin
LPVADRSGRTSAQGVYVAGDGAGILGADAAEISGRLAALAVLADIKSASVAGSEEIKRLQRQHARLRRFAAGLEQAFPWPAALAAATADDTLVCRCEAVRAAELRSAASNLDAREVNRAKSFVRVGMGRCQGRYCGPAAAEILAAHLGCPTEHVGRLRSQHPIKPLPVRSERAS